MTVEKFWINNEEYDVGGSGYDSDGEISKAGIQVKLKENPTFLKFINSIVLNNNAQLVFEDVKVRVGDKKEIAVRKALGSPTEAALLVFAEKAGYIPYDIKKEFSLIKEFTFSSELKRMSSIYSQEKENKNVFVLQKELLKKS